MDACPNQPLKQEPGTCGCDIPDEDSAEVASCIPMRGALAHRYSFNVPGAVVVDTARNRWDANIVGAVAAGGAVSLGGSRSGEYVNLRNGILSKLTSVTLEAWLTWAGPSGGDWQRVFDFGDDDTMVEGNRSGGRTYLFMTPMLPDVDTPFARVAFQGPAVQREAMLTATRALPSGSAVHVVFTFDDAEKRLALYMDGELDVERMLDSTSDVAMSLSEINDINCWLGRSQYAADADFGGSIDEFRIYSSALTALQVRTSNLAGPNPSFLP
jgi:arabinan endo-1,5-alpha-L-arabinosidase